MGFGRLNPICWGPNTRAQENACQKNRSRNWLYLYKKNAYHSQNFLAIQESVLRSEYRLNFSWLNRGKNKNRVWSLTRERKLLFFSKSVQSLKYQVLVRSTKVQCLVMELGLDLDPRKEKALFKTNSAINSKKS